MLLLSDTFRQGPKYHVPILASSVVTNIVVPGQVGKRIVVLAYVIIAAGDVTVTWSSGGFTDLSGPMPISQRGGVSAPEAAHGHFATREGEDLVINLGGVVTVGGHCLVMFVDEI